MPDEIDYFTHDAACFAVNTISYYQFLFLPHTRRATNISFHARRLRHAGHENALFLYL